MSYGCPRDHYSMTLHSRCVITAQKKILKQYFRACEYDQKHLLTLKIESRLFFKAVYIVYLHRIKRTGFQTAVMKTRLLKELQRQCNI